MKRLLAAALLATACAHPIGSFSPLELKAQGRPREAWVALQKQLAEDPGHDPRVAVLHKAALLHAGGDWVGSELAFAQFEALRGYELLGAERTILMRLRATNTLALRRDAQAFAAAFPERSPLPPAPGRGKLVLVFERGGAPVVRVHYDQATKARYTTVDRPLSAAARWQLDDEAAATVQIYDSLQAAWGGQLQSQADVPRNPLDPFAPLRDAFGGRRQIWWSAPTDWSIAEREVNPGPHVVTVATVAGRRPQRVDVAAGATVYLVVPQ